MIGVLERYGPLSVAVAVAALLWFFSGVLLFEAAAGRLDVSALYSAMFDWSSIQTGFLFGIFGYVSGKSSGFLVEVSKTSAMQTFNSYTKTAILLGFTVTLISIPLIVTKFEIATVPGHYFWFFIPWAFIATWSFFAFVRVAYVFGVMLKVRDRDRVVG